MPLPGNSGKKSFFWTLQTSHIHQGSTSWHPDLISWARCRIQLVEQSLWGIGHQYLGTKIQADGSRTFLTQANSTSIMTLKTSSMTLIKLLRCPKGLVCLLVRYSGQIPTFGVGKLVQIFPNFTQCAHHHICTVPYQISFSFCVRHPNMSVLLLHSLHMFLIHKDF